MFIAKENVHIRVPSKGKKDWTRQSRFDIVSFKKGDIVPKELEMHILKKKEKFENIVPKEGIVPKKEKKVEEDKNSNSGKGPRIEWDFNKLKALGMKDLRKMLIDLKVKNKEIPKKEDDRIKMIMEML